jgi:methyl-accepting chemotaxis protein
LLKSVAAFAYDRRKYLQNELRWGEGLPGTCALEKERIFITDVPEDYYEVISGTGSTKPKSILFVPLKIEEIVFGVLELASLRVLENYEIEFVESIAESIASTLHAVKTNEKTAQLLKQSMKQANQLISKDEKMKQNIEELERAREASRKNESEITGILNAMNLSSLVAEYGINGRISRVNNKFIMMMESSEDQIIGKHHSEFAQVEKYSDEYKGFWSSLRKGNSHSKEEKFKLYSGKEVWLQQSFTPIFNEEGKVYKILNIAIDITQIKDQQRDLETQAGEIMRSSREIETLNQAVNTSIIKCEMDADGIITDLNQNFSEVTGYSRKELLGRNYRLFLKDIEKDQFEKIWAEIHKEKTYEGVMRRTKPTGEEGWLMSTFSPVKDEGGEIYKIYFLALDITEKKLKYQLLEDANNEVERLRNSLNKYEDV